MRIVIQSTGSLKVFQHLSDVLQPQYQQLIACNNPKGLQPGLYSTDISKWCPQTPFTLFKFIKSGCWKM